MSSSIFNKKKKIILGMIHLEALPGTPFYVEDNYERIKINAIENAITLQKAGVDGCIIQNGNDRVYQNDIVDPILVSVFTDICKEIRNVTRLDFQIGINIMRNQNIASLAVAKITNCSFIRCSNLIGSTVTNSGMMSGNPFDIAQYQKMISAQSIEIIAEIYSDHFKWLGNKEIDSIAVSAIKSGASSVAIGDNNESKVIEFAKKIKGRDSDIPIIISGYTNHENITRLIREADGVIVGSCIENKNHSNKIDLQLAKDYVNIAHSIN